MAKIVKLTIDKGEMKCPFLDQSAGVMSDCMREACALWLDDVGQCSIPVLARQALGKQHSKAAGPTGVAMQTF